MCLQGKHGNIRLKSGLTEQSYRRVAEVEV
jgi:hypothetical protein